MVHSARPTSAHVPWCRPWCGRRRSPTSTSSEAARRAHASAGRRTRPLPARRRSWASCQTVVGTGASASLHAISNSCSIPPLARIGVAAVAMAEEDGLSDASSAETVEQHPDCRGEPDEGNEDTDGDGSGGDGGGSGESEHDDSESDTDDGGAEDHPAVVVTHNACGEGTLTVVSVALASSRSGKAPSKTQKYVYLRDLEYHLDGTAGRSTSRLPKKLGNMGVSDTLRVVEAKSVRDGKVTHEEWTALLSAYMDMMRSRDALATTARRFTLVPTRVAAMIAQDESNKYILLALGKQLPKKWAAAEAREEARVAGGVDFNAEAILEESEDCDELAEIAFEDELAMAGYAEFEESEADVAQARTYKLTTISKALAAEISAFKARRTRVICRHRAGRAVQSTTVESDIGTLLRFLGWMKTHRQRTDGEEEPPALTMKAVVGSCEFGRYVEEYVGWLQERGVLFSSIANYTNSLVSLLTYVMSDEGYEATDESVFTIYEQLCNIRRQAHSAAAQDRMYRRRNPNWIEWVRCQEIRMDCIDKYEGTKGAPAKKMSLLRDVVVLCSLTCLPPDRVGVIRLLRFDHTLRWIPDVDEDPDGPGAWWIDLTARSARHKTSRFYGPAMTRLPDTLGHYISVYKQAKEAVAAYEFESGGAYLFAGRDGRAFAVSSWTTVVKVSLVRGAGRARVGPWLERGHTHRPHRDVLLRHRHRRRSNDTPAGSRRRPSSYVPFS
mmetsp:Transcript_103739/g.298466  ORF Transcript_103739/g.298466 Transcript_103739/m.298466 type:complete len:726 (-) Transcript_103739:375-2552(-)